MEVQLRQIKAQMETAARQLRAAAAATLAAHAEQVADDARALAPVDTGELRDSIQVVKTDELHYTVEVTAPYAIEVELGTADQAAQPFLFSAFEANRTELQAKLTARLKNS